MTIRTIVATVTLAVLPFLAVAAAQHPDHHPEQTAMVQGAGSGTTPGHRMGQGMMNIITQVRSDLASLANENDLANLHKKIAQDWDLLGQFQSHMQSMQGMSGAMMSGGMMSGGMMHRGTASGHMSNCPGAAAKTQE